MNSKTANISEAFEKKIMNLLKNKSSGFGRSGAMAGGLLGGGVGAVGGLASAAKSQMEGEMDDYSGEQILSNYLSSAGQMMGHGAALGLGAGLAGGKFNKNRLALQNAEKLAPYVKDQLSRGATEKELLQAIGKIKTTANKGLEEIADKGIFSNLQQSVSGLQGKGSGISSTIDDLVAQTGQTPASVLARTSSKPDMVEEINRMTSGSSSTPENTRKTILSDLKEKLDLDMKNRPLPSRQQGVPSSASVERLSESSGLKDIMTKAEEQRAAEKADKALKQQKRHDDIAIWGGTKELSPEEHAVRDLEAKMVADPKNKQHLDDLAKAQIELTETQEAKRLAGLYDQTKDPQYAQQLSELNGSRLARSEAAAAEQKARADQTLAAQKAQNAADAAEQKASRAQSNSDQIENLSQKAKHTLALKLEEEMNKAIRKGDITTAQRLQRDLTQLTRGAGGQKKPRGKTGKKP